MLGDIRGSQRECQAKQSLSLNSTATVQQHFTVPRRVIGTGTGLSVGTTSCISSRYSSSWDEVAPLSTAGTQ